MTLRTTIYVTAVALAGAIVLTSALFEGNWAQPWGFFAYCVATLLASSLRVKLFSTAGVLPLSYVFVIAGIALSSRIEAVVIGVIAALVQTYWRPAAPPTFRRSIFNISLAILIVSSLYRLYHYSPWISNESIRLVVAGCVFFAVQSIGSAIATAFDEQRPILQVWRGEFLWAFPYYVAGAALAALVVVSSSVWGWAATLMVLPALYVIFHSYQLYLRQLEGQKSYAEQMASLHLRTIEALALAIEAKDQTTGQHLRRVQVYAREIAKELGLSECEQKALQAASILHDVGKLAVPDYIISKPGRLTPEEFEKMKVHPVVGAEIVETIDFPYDVAPIVRAHHEKWDGSGYPHGLRGEEIPIGARILNCVDCFDALASDRQYRRALPLGEALDFVLNESGKSFDPRIVQILARRYEELEQMAEQEPIAISKKLSTGLKITRGNAPDAGFQPGSVRQPRAPRTTPESYVPKIAEARQEMHSLYEVIQVLGNSLTLQEMLAILAERIRGLVPYDGIAIYMREDQKLLPKYVNGENYSLFSSLQIPIGQGLSGWVAENHKPILNGNPSVEPAYLDDPTKFSVLNSAVAAPLEGLTGCIGVLALYSLKRDAYSREHLRILQAISAKLTAAIERLSAEDTHRPVKDALTDLPTAAGIYMRLEAELSHAAEIDREVSVFVLDLDGLSEINHQFGNGHGDRVLAGVADALQKVCGEKGHVGRMGGDEFVVVLPNSGRTNITYLVDLMVKGIRDVGASLDLPGPLTVSIGTAMFPADGHDADALLAAADRGVAAFKKARKQSVAASLLGLAKNVRTSAPVSSPILTPVEFNIQDPS